MLGAVLVALQLESVMGIVVESSAFTSSSVQAVWLFDSPYLHSEHAQLKHAKKND